MHAKTNIHILYLIHIRAGTWLVCKYMCLLQKILVFCYTLSLSHVILPAAINWCGNPLFLYFLLVSLLWLWLFFMLQLFYICKGGVIIVIVTVVTRFIMLTDACHSNTSINLWVRGEILVVTPHLIIYYNNYITGLVYNQMKYLWTPYVIL